MDLSSLNLSPGLVFSSNVRKYLGVYVNYTGKTASKEFVLLVSFSRFKFRLSSDAVGICLQAALGGTAKCFEAVKLQDQIFRFAVSYCDVGFLILKLRPFSCDQFKMAFHLCNDLGFQSAISSKSDSGPTFEWVEVRPKKQKPSYVEIVESAVPPVSGANVVPLGSSSQVCFCEEAESCCHFGFGCQCSSVGFSPSAC